MFMILACLPSPLRAAQEMAGIMNFFLDLNPTSSPKTLSQAMDTLRFFARHNINEEFPELFAAVRHHVDETFSTALRSAVA